MPIGYVIKVIDEDTNKRVEGAKIRTTPPFLGGHTTGRNGQVRGLIPPTPILRVVVDAPGYVRHEAYFVGPLPFDVAEVLISKKATVPQVARWEGGPPLFED